MVRVLIPFTEPKAAERAVQRLLDEPRRSELEVELLAIVEPLTAGKVGIYLTRRRAEALARAAAEAWLERIGARLLTSGIAWRGRVALGRAAKVIAAAMTRDDVDRVLLSAPRRFPPMLARHRVALARGAHLPVTLVR